METKKQEYYDSQAIIIEGEETAYAKKVYFDIHPSKEGKLIQYFIKTCDGVICNPVNFENQRRSLKNKVKFTKTNELAFMLYLRFLKTKNQSAYFQAQRKMGG